MPLTRVHASQGLLAAILSLAGGACVSPDSFIRMTDGGPGVGAGGDGVTGGGGGPGAGGTTGAAGKTGSGGSPGVAGTTGSAGHVGTGGSPGTGGTVIGPTPNFMDDFEHGNTWISDSPTDGRLNPSSTPGCGDWAVVTDPANPANHVFQQRSTACTTSNPSWSANGNAAWTDMRMQAKVQFAAGAPVTTRITLGVRFTDDRTQYFLEFTNDGKIKIRAKSQAGGASSDLSNPSNGRVAVPSGQWVTIALAISGTTASVYLGEDRTAPPVLTGTVSGASVGGIGLGVVEGTAFFDDVLVTAP